MSLLRFMPPGVLVVDGDVTVRSRIGVGAEDHAGPGGQRKGTDHREAVTTIIAEAPGPRDRDRCWSGCRPRTTPQRRRVRLPGSASLRTPARRRGECCQRGRPLARRCGRSARCGQVGPTGTHTSLAAPGEPKSPAPVGCVDSHQFPPMSLLMASRDPASRFMAAPVGSGNVAPASQITMSRVPVAFSQVELVRSIAEVGSSVLVVDGDATVGQGVGVDAQHDPRAGGQGQGSSDGVALTTVVSGCSGPRGRRSQPWCCRFRSILRGCRWLPRGSA